jgi:hypothetical protein
MSGPEIWASAYQTAQIPSLTRVAKVCVPPRILKRVFYMEGTREDCVAFGVCGAGVGLCCSGVLPTIAI